MDIELVKGPTVNQEPLIQQQEPLIQNEKGESWRYRCVRIITGVAALGGAITLLRFHDLVPLITWPAMGGLLMTAVTVPLNRLDVQKNIPPIVQGHFFTMGAFLGAALLHTRTEPHNEDEGSIGTGEAALCLLGFIINTLYIIRKNRPFQPACSSTHED